jgi:predicted Rossmann fold nucleotide-binding protein DprA/Smf involved in DNA uptake
VIAAFPDLAAASSDTRRRRERDTISHLNAQEKQLYSLIGLEPLHIDDIISRANVPPAQAAHCLLTLQLEELIQEVEGRRYMRKP